MPLYCHVLQRVLRQMLPAILGVSVGQISLIINTIFASFLVSGSVSWMYYADRLMEFPSGVLGVALGTILLPSLAKSFASGNHDEYSRLMDWGLRLCFLLALPMRELLMHLAGVRGFWSYFLPLDLVMSSSLFYELLEWAAAVVFGGGLGAAFLGTQGDEWDAHRDMALAGIGGLIAILLIYARNRRARNRGRGHELP